MVRSNTLVFCIVVLSMTATYCIGWPRQQDNSGINLSMERLLTKRAFLDQLFSGVDASRRLPRAVPARRPAQEEVHEDVHEPVPARRPTARRPAQQAACPCPCGPDTYVQCSPGCQHEICASCPCPCVPGGYASCPIGCRPRTSCDGR